MEDIEGRSVAVQALTVYKEDSEEHPNQLYDKGAARVLRMSLKSDLKQEAAKRDDSQIQYIYWTRGKPLLEEEKLKKSEQEIEKS
ncbi:unnamed protein product [Parnassius apollo]|uniref:(apollo) hypothetical protein n=1 Tax=Parnassius apollo TaxID=110799 RepID=A0A8S3XS64_PARAO|nr:unnamed protein product [Parnassius apollo]